uniref:Uncharacterized protein n=1 Tax=Anopheles coluzzii TaxID=1518534 RepID=A0A8W7PNM6_ANOCL
MASENSFISGTSRALPCSSSSSSAAFESPSACLDEQQLLVSSVARSISENVFDFLRARHTSSCSIFFASVILSIMCSTRFLRDDFQLSRLHCHSSASSTSRGGFTSCCFRSVDGLLFALLGSYSLAGLICTNCSGSKRRNTTYNTATRARKARGGGFPAPLLLFFRFTMYSLSFGQARSGVRGSGGSIG